MELAPDSSTASVRSADGSGIFSLLAQDHHDLLAELRQLNEERDPTRLKAAMGRLRIELLAHTRAERRTLYQALTTRPATRELATSGQHEHNELIDQLNRVWGRLLTRSDPTAALAKLVSLFATHSHAEEAELFPLARVALAESTQDRLAREYCREKQRQTQSLEHDLVPPSSSRPSIRPASVPPSSRLRPEPSHL